MRFWTRRPEGTLFRGGHPVRARGLLEQCFDREVEDGTLVELGL